MEVGHHCKLDTCSRLSFLPIACPYCNDAFCESHYLPDQHKCATAPSSVLSEEQLAHRLASSQRGGRLPCQKPGCKGLSFQISPSPALEMAAPPITGSQRTFTFSAPRCDRCQGFFCAYHRSAVRHGCTAAAPLTEGQLKLKAVQDRKAKAASVLAKHFPNHKT